MTLRNQYETAREEIRATRKEMEKDGLDLLEQVIVLLIGGILGGQALSIAEANHPILVDLLLYFVLLAVGLFTLGTIHFAVSYHRVIQAGSE